MMKAVHEAKQQTSWVVNNKPFEDAVNAFIDKILVAPTLPRRMLEKIVAHVLLSRPYQLPHPDAAEAHRPRRPGPLPGR